MSRDDDVAATKSAAENINNGDLDAAMQSFAVDAVADTLNGTHRRELQGIPATVETMEIRGMQIGRFENGQTVERWGASDELGLLRQLGA